MRATGTADFGDLLANAYRSTEGMTFERFVRSSAVSSVRDEDVWADLIRADVQLRLVRGLPLSLEDYRRASAVGESEVLVDAAVQAIVHALMARGRTRREAFDELRAANPALESRIETAEVLSSLLGSAAMDPPAPTALPRRIGPKTAGGVRRYELLHQLGRGSQAVVYRAIDHELSTPERPSWVAVKLWGARGPTRRMLAEAERARQIDHPNVIKVFDAGVTPEGEAYMVSPIIEGRTLEDAVLARDRCDADQAAEWMIRVCAGVQAMHAAGLLHRDLKPGNILIDARGEAVVADLGLSVRYEPGAEGGADRAGTLAFGAPEQWGGRGGLSTASDTYALGAALLWALTGRAPHGSDRAAAEAALSSSEAHRSALAPVLAGVADVRLRRICERATAFDPRGRYAAAEGLASDLAAWRARNPIAWMRPTAAERVRLWVSRAPGQAAAAAVVLSAMIIAPAGVLWGQSRAERARAELAMEREARASQNLENARSYATGLFESTRIAADPLWRDNSLPAMMILEELKGPVFLTDKGLNHALWGQRIDVAGENVSRAKRGSIDWLLWSEMRGMWLLRAERCEEGQAVLRVCEAELAKICGEDDPWLADARALRAAADVGVMNLRRVEAGRRNLPKPNFTAEEREEVVSRLERILDDSRPTRRVYYLSLGALLDLNGTGWDDRPGEVRRLNKELEDRKAGLRAVAPAEKP